MCIRDSNTPVWRLLGGQREELPVYVTGGWLGTDEELVNEALGYQKAGYTRLDVYKRQTQQSAANTGTARPQSQNSRPSRPHEQNDRPVKVQPQMTEEEIKELDSGIEANGILEVMPDGFGFIRCENYLPGENDVYVAPSQIRRFNMKTGDIIVGSRRVKTAAEKFAALLYVKTINGYTPAVAERRPDVYKRQGGRTAKRDQHRQRL